MNTWSVLERSPHFVHPNIPDLFVTLPIQHLVSRSLYFSYSRRSSTLFPAFILPTSWRPLHCPTARKYFHVISSQVIPADIVSRHWKPLRDLAFRPSPHPPTAYMILSDKYTMNWRLHSNDSADNVSFRFQFQTPITQTPLFTPSIQPLHSEFTSPD